MSVSDHDFDVRSSITSLFKIASNDHSGWVNMSPLEIRIRATLALAVFLPHPQAKKNLISLMASSNVPKEVRSVASEALTGNSNGVEQRQSER